MSGPPETPLVTVDTSALVVLEAFARHRRGSRRGRCRVPHLRIA